MVITDTRKDTQCVNGTDHCEVFFDFNENNFQLWDKTINSNPARQGKIILDRFLTKY